MENKEKNIENNIEENIEEAIEKNTQEASMFDAQEEEPQSLDETIENLEDFEESNKVVIECQIEDKKSAQEKL